MPSRSSSRVRAALALLPLVFLALPAHGGEVAASVANAVEPSLCAEKDNVTVTLTSAQVRSFRVEAEHPAYIGMLAHDRSTPDWRNCADIPHGEEYTFEPQRITLYETISWQIVGYTFAKFWRPSTASVSVGDRSFSNLHLIQLWTRVDERAEEVLVLYPGDGYWRARPLPPKHLGWSAYGSSFLIGPVETQGRPIVDLKAIRIDPKALTFALDFVRGGSARLRVSDLDREHIGIDVILDRAVEGRPFAALRSMFVTDLNADVAEVGWREPGGQNWRGTPLPSFTRADIVELWLGRKLASRHNTSAPDMSFGHFRDDDQVIGTGPARASDR